MTRYFYKLLNFTSADAKKLKERMQFVKDDAFVHLDISKNLVLFNKKKQSKAKRSYLFWDIENFSNISPMFTDIIEPLEKHLTLLTLQSATMVKT